MTLRLAACLAVGLAGPLFSSCGGRAQPSGGGTATAVDTPEETESSSRATGSGDAAPCPPLAVYYLGDDGTRSMLYRERVSLSVADCPGAAQDRARAAVAAMLTAPRDPDYATPWPTGTRVRALRIEGDVARVDLSGTPTAMPVGSAAACLALQQLVYTLTDAAPSVQRVALARDGATDGAVSRHGGVGCGHDRPLERHTPAYEIVAPVQIERPGEGADVSRNVTVVGEATVFEATVSWSIVDVRSSEELSRGFVTASAGGPARGTWSFTASLPAEVSGRTVELRAWESSARDGRVTHLDTKRVRVR